MGPFETVALLPAWACRLRPSMLALVMILIGGECLNGAAPRAYQLDLVVATNQTIAGKTITDIVPGLANGPVINDAGTIAFLGSFEGGSGIFTQDRLLVESGDVISGVRLDHFAQPAINNAGTIAFFATSGNASAQGIFTQYSSVALVGESIAGKTLAGSATMTAPSINARGDVAFVGRFSDGFGILVNKSLLVQTGDLIGGNKMTNLEYPPSINNAGMVAFRADTPLGQGIFSQRKAIVEPTVVIDGQTVTVETGVFGVPLTESGGVAFKGSFANGEGVFTDSALVVKTGTTIEGLTANIINNPTMNNRGTIVFWAADTTSGGQGITTQDHVVVRSGDVIAGRTVNIVSAVAPGINSSGEIAVLARFTDGSTGVVVARPKGGSQRQ